MSIFFVFLLLLTLDVLFKQDEETLRKTSLLRKVPDSSEEDNELGDEMMSGENAENDVEYAEFSLSVRTSPKEQIQNGSIESNSSNGIESTAPNGFDDFMSLPISSQSSNLAGVYKN